MSATPGLYEFLEPGHRRRRLFTSYEYAVATLEEAYWMRRQETALITLPDVLEWLERLERLLHRVRDTGGSP